MSWKALVDHIMANYVAIEAAAGVLFVAFVSNMPKTPPASMVEYWQWVRDSLQTAIPAARAQHAAQQPENPTPGPQGPQTKP